MDDAKQALKDVAARLESAAIEVVEATSHDRVALVEDAITGAIELSGGLNNWDFRWPLNTYARDMDRDRLSQEARDRLAAAEAMTHEEYQALVLKRQGVRDTYEALKSDVEVCVTLSAPGPAPVGLDWTGDPVFAVPSSVFARPLFRCRYLNPKGCRSGFRWSALPMKMRPPCPPPVPCWLYIQTNILEWPPM